MKNSLLVLALLSTIFGSVSAYNLSIENTSDFTLRAKIGFGAGVVGCEDKQFRIMPHSTKKYQTGGCCLYTFELETIEYNGKDGHLRSVVGQTMSAKGRSTGFGLSCRDNSFRVHVSNQGHITIENK